MGQMRPSRLIQYTDPGYQEPQQPPRGMGRMIIGSIVLISTIILLIIMFTVFDEPIQILTDTFTTAYPDTYGGADSVEQMNNFLTMIFGIAIAVGVLMALLWYMIWGHKREYERY